MPQSQTITISSGDVLTVRSSDGSPLNLTESAYHPDSITISVEGGGVEPPNPTPTGLWIGAARPSAGVVYQRFSLSAGYAEATIPLPDPHGTPVVIGSEIWSMRDGVWTSPTGEQQQFGQVGDIPLGGKFGKIYGKCVGRAGDPYDDGTPSRKFIFPPSDGAPEEMIGSGPNELSFAHCWGNKPEQWWLGQAYPGGIWFRQFKHGAEKRLGFPYQQGDYIVSALFDGQHPGVALIHQGTWMIWYDINALPHMGAVYHPDFEFAYGDASDIPLACG